MSEEVKPSEDDDGGIFCQNCSPTTRTIGYYVTFIVGFIIFIIGVFDLFDNKVTSLIIGGLIVLFTPLWIKSPKSCLFQFKDALRTSSFLIYFLFLVLTIISHFFFDQTFTIIFGIFLGVTGIWYFLSFIPGGHQFLITCCKGCWGSSSTTTEGGK